MADTAQHPLGSGFGATSTSEQVLSGVDVAGMTAVVTGGYSGLGLATSAALSEAGARVIVPARRPEEARDALADVAHCTVVQLDLADLSSVGEAAGHILEIAPSIDLMINAAGIMATPLRRVGDGWESQFAVNHLGHYALVNHLWPALVAGGTARVVSYSSVGHQLSDIRWDDPNFETGYDKWLAYGQSKTADVLLAVHLDMIGKPHGVQAFAVHPGGILTGLQRDVPREEQIKLGWIDELGNVAAGFKTPSQGAATGLWAATSPELDGLGGVYCEDCDVAEIAASGRGMRRSGVREYAIDPDQAARLWQLSATLTGLDAVA